MRRVFLNKGVKNRYDLWKFLRIYFHDYLQQKEQHDKAEYKKAEARKRQQQVESDKNEEIQRAFICKLASEIKSVIPDLESIR